MATIQNAVQTMVDKLVADMQGNDPLSAEDQALVSNAITKLADNGRLEKAIIAVAEEHLDVATGELTSASAVVLELKTQLATQVTNLALLPTLESKITEITNNLINNVATALKALPVQLEDPKYSLGQAEFVLDYYDNTTGLIQGTKQSYGAHNTISLVNYDSGHFHLYFDGGEKTNASNKAVIMSIDENGSILSAVRSTRLVSTTSEDHLGFAVMPNLGGALFSFVSASEQFTIFKENSFEVVAIQDADYFKIFQDPETKYIYLVNAGILHEFNGLNFLQKRDVIFDNEAAFVNWGANEKRFEALHQATISPINNSSTAITSSTGYSTNGSSLPVTRPAVIKELACRNGKYTLLDHIGTQQLARNLTSTYSGRNDNLLYTKSFKSRINLPSIDGEYVASLESVTANNNYNSSHSSYDQQYYPQLISSSPIHRSIVTYQYFKFYHNGSNTIEISQCRVYKS